MTCICEWRYDTATISRARTADVFAGGFTILAWVWLETEDPPKWVGEKCQP